MIDIGKYIFIVGVLFALPHFSFGQIDTNRIDSTHIHAIDPLKSQTIDAVSVSLERITLRRFRLMETGLESKDIEVLAPDDPGELLSKLPSVNVKSYGGLGGLKTVSFHSMGSGHTSVVLDGVALNNSQSGQVNLSQIQSDGLYSVIALSDMSGNLYVPVSARIAGNTIQMNSFRLKINKAYSLKANVKYGSFNRQDAYVSGSALKGKKWMFSAYGKYRQADGDYKYTFLNGLTEVDGVRGNNDYRDVFFGGQIQYKMKKGDRIRFGYKGSYIDQGLPGAVILYNETADERLNTNDHIVYADAFWGYKNMAFRAYGNANQNDLNYFDPTYFNNEGEIDVNYLNRSAVIGMNFERYRFQKLNFSGGVEETVSSLVSSDSSLSNPIRFHSKALFLLSRSFSFGAFSTGVSGQYVSENTRLGASANELFKVNPQVSFNSKESKKYHFQHKGMYKNSFRMPSFNELYYNSVGNSNLQPETAHQFLYGVRVIPLETEKKDLVIRSSLYFNRVNNKIVAIPTKNLFVWSMQNVTDVNIFGGDISGEFKWNLGECKYGVFANYTYQKAVDVTEGTLNFGDQIAYTPEHMANLDFTFVYKEFGCRLSNNFTGGRYALNENVESNFIDGYLISDIAVYYAFKLKKGNQIKIQANVKNVFNQSYAYVRSFVLPGRNYLISLSYALN